MNKNCGNQVFIVEQYPCPNFKAMSLGQFRILLMLFFIDLYSQFVETFPRKIKVQEQIISYYDLNNYLVALLLQSRSVAPFPRRGKETPNLGRLQVCWQYMSLKWLFLGVMSYCNFLTLVSLSNSPVMMKQDFVNAMLRRTLVCIYYQYKNPRVGKSEW